MLMFDDITYGDILNINSSVVDENGNSVSVLLKLTLVVFIII